MTEYLTREQHDEKNGPHRWQRHQSVSGPGGVREWVCLYCRTRAHELHDSCITRDLPKTVEGRMELHQKELRELHQKELRELMLDRVAAEPKARSNTLFHALVAVVLVTILMLSSFC